jgi:hypothetical protein
MVALESTPRKSCPTSIGVDLCSVNENLMISSHIDERRLMVHNFEAVYFPEEIGDVERLGTKDGGLKLV